MIEAEEASETTRAAAREATALTTSAVAYVEVRSAVARRHGDRRATNGLAAARRILDSTWVEMAKVPLSDAVLAGAGDLAERHRLRALDALHVASALDVAASATERVVFASFDRDQRDGARREGLVLFPTEL